MTLNPNLIVTPKPKIGQGNPAMHTGRSSKRPCRPAAVRGVLLLPCPPRRLHFCDAATQRKYFERQFELARASGLPMFLHLRAAADDFLDIVGRHSGRSWGAGRAVCCDVQAEGLLLRSC